MKVTEYSLFAWVHKLAQLKEDTSPSTGKAANYAGEELICI